MDSTLLLLSVGCLVGGATALFWTWRVLASFWVLMLFSMGLTAFTGGLISTVSHLVSLLLSS